MRDEEALLDVTGESVSVDVGSARRGVLGWVLLTPLFFLRAYMMRLDILKVI